MLPAGGLIKNEMENYKNNENEILKAFEIYKNIVFATGVDLSFWKSFMELSINEYKKGNAQSAELFTAGFFCLQS